MTKHIAFSTAVLESAYSPHLKLRSFYGSEDPAGMGREFVIYSSCGVNDEEDCYSSVFLAYDPALDDYVSKLRTSYKTRRHHLHTGSSLYRSESNKPG